MAVKNHALDQRIVDAARAEFLEHGFQKASLHKIADRAGITTGALYTRYRSKDDLFCSLVKSALTEAGTQFAPVQQLYLEAQQQRSSEALLTAIRQEESIYLNLLFQHYEECVLLFCRSGGSSLELMLNSLMEQKSAETVEFFRKVARPDSDLDGIHLIMSQQFYYYRQILQQGYSKEKAVSCMKTVEFFLEAGWKALFDKIM